MILVGAAAMLQAAVCDGVPSGPLSLRQDSPATSNIDVGGGEVVRFLVVAPAIAVLDEGFDVGLERTRQRVVSQLGPIHQGLMPALVFALGVGVIRYAAYPSP